MGKYLVYDYTNNLLKVVDDKSGYKNERTIDLQSGHQLQLYYADIAKKEIDPIVKYLKAELNTGLFKLLLEAKSAVEQLVAKAHKRVELMPGTKILFLFLGASPKVVKWAMKQSCEGGPHIVRSLSVSGLSKALEVKLVGEPRRWEKTRHKPTPDFTTYLKGKLEGIEDNDAILLLDFASTGASLRRIKEDVEALLHDELNKVGVGVFMMAVGSNISSSDVKDIQFIQGIPVLEALMKGKSSGYREKVRQAILKDYPTLKEHDQIKKMIGRRSKFNPYQNWRNETRLDKYTETEKFDFFKSIFRSTSSEELLVMIEKVTKPNPNDMLDT